MYQFQLKNEKSRKTAPTRTHTHMYNTSCIGIVSTVIALVQDH